MLCWKGKGYTPEGLPKEPNTETDDVNTRPIQINSQLEALKKAHQELELKLSKRDEKIEKLQKSLSRPKKAVEKVNRELEEKLKERDQEIENLQEALSKSNKDLENDLKQTLKERDKKIERLQKASKSYLALKNDHQKLEQRLKERDKKIETLQKALSGSNMPTTSSNPGRRMGIHPTDPEPQQPRNSVNETPKSPKQRKFLREAIISNDYLKHLSEDQVNEMIAMMQRTVPSNDTFIKEGTNGDRLYILESGELEISQACTRSLKISIDGETKNQSLRPPSGISFHVLPKTQPRALSWCQTGALPNIVEVLSQLGHAADVGKRFLRNITPPSVFGELALLYRCKRTATVTAKSPTKVWMIERNMFQDIMKNTTITRRSELMQALHKVSWMQQLGSNKLGKLTEVLEEESFERGQYIVRQGEAGEIFYIIMEGEVDVTEQGQEDKKATFIRTLGKGSYFGEKALRNETGKREVNVIAKNEVRCMTLEKKPFLSLIGNVADKDWEASERRPTLLRPHKASVFKDYTLRDFELVGVLGIGGFGRVELVRLKKEPNRSFALKCMKKVHIVETKQEAHIYSEKEIMLKSNSTFIVQLYRTFKNEKYVYMLMEACLGGELWAMLRDDGYFDEGRTRFYAACVVEAIEYLHLHGVVYRDIKPENLLLDERGYVKVVDFGFAKTINHGEKTWTFCGTPEYVAPEIVLNKGHDVAVDYWALGILIFEMLTGTPPFGSSDPMEIYRQILRGVDVIEWSQKISTFARNLIRRLCRENPSERIGNLRNGTNDIRNHRWFSGFDWLSLRNGNYSAPYVPKITNPNDLRNFDRFDQEEEIVEKETSGWDKEF